jgi:hypothetical protein
MEYAGPKMKTVVILQSNYIPWKGYFDLMHDADEFVLLDDVQYTRQDWRNRNQVKAACGPQWLTIPVKARFGQRIDETEIARPDWAPSHWSRIVQLYRKTPHFSAYADRVEDLYMRAAGETLLARVNKLFLAGLGTMLGIETRLRASTEFPAIDGRTERLVGLCRAVNATRYVSGPAAKSYLQGELFDQAGIDLTFKSYDGYPEYPQAHPPFIHGVSVLDLLFSVGPDAPWYIWGWRACPPSALT